MTARSKRRTTRPHNQTQREREAQLRLAIRASNVGLWDWDIAGGSVYFSPEWKRQLGYLDEELPNRFEEWESRLHPDDRDRALEQIRSYLADLSPDYQAEFRLRHKDGSYRWIYTRAELLRDSAGEPQRMLGCHLDITERVLAEQRAAAEKQILGLIARNAPSASVLDRLCSVYEGQLSFGASCSILMLDADGIHVRHGAAPSLPDRYIAAIDGSAIGPAAGSCGTAAYLGEQVIVSDIATDPRWRDYRELALRDGLLACWSTPIFSDTGKVLGTFAIYYRETRAPGKSELQLIERATHLASIALGRDLAERSLRESEEKLRLFVEHAPSAIAMFDRNMRYLAWSRRWLGDYGLEKVDLAGRSHYDVFPDLPERWKVIHLRCLDGATEKNEEDPFPRADGTVDWVRWEVRPWRTGGGEIGGLIIFSEVITERKRAEEAVRESEQRYRATFDQAAVGIARVALDGRWLEVNQRLCDIVGYEREELLARTFQDITHPDDLHADLEHVRELLTGEIQTYSMEKRYFRKSGEIVWINLTVALVRAPDGAPKYFVSVVEDINQRKRAEEALQESEERLRLATEAAQVGTWDWDLVANRLRWDPTLLRMFGFEPGRLEGNMEAWLERVHPEDRPRVQATLRNALGDRRLYAEEFRIRGPADKERWIAADGRALGEQNGRAVRMVGVARDITDRKRAEEALQESEAKLRELIDGLGPDNFVGMLSLDGIVLEANRPALAAAGLKRADVLGKPVEQTYWFAYSEPLQRQLRNAVRAAAAGMGFRGDVEIRVAQDTVAWVDLSIQPMRADTGHTPHLAASAVVITERKRVEEALRESEEQYRRIVNLSPDAVTIHQDGRWVFANPAAARILGVEESSQLVGTSLLDFMHPDVHEEVRGRWKQLYEDKQPVDAAELKMVRPDGAVVYLETRAVHVVWQGRPAAQVVARDVTERKLAEGALREYAERLKGLSQRLMEAEETERRNINRELHDRIGQNLSALNLNLNLIRSGLPKPSQRTIEARFDEVQLLVEETTAHVRNVMAELHPPALDDYGLFAALRTYAETRSTQAGVSVLLKTGNAVPRLSQTVELALFRILQEALNNAIKHARPKQIDITLATEGGRVTLAIADDGKGIDPARADAEARSWGLTIMRERAEAIGAQLRIESEPGRGTRVVVEVAGEFP
jgi:PAS domain S-box-containing protein